MTPVQLYADSVSIKASPAPRLVNRGINHFSGAPNENIVQNHFNIAFIVKRNLVFKRYMYAYYYSLKIFHLSVRIS